MNKEEALNVQLVLEELKATGTKIQSVLCSKERFKTAAEARAWCKAHNFKSSKVDETDDYYRFRQFPPGNCTSGTYGTISLTDGVKAVTCVPKE